MTELLEQQDHKDQQEMTELLEQQDHKDQQEMTELLEQQDHKDQQEMTEQQVQPALMDQMLQIIGQNLEVMFTDLQATLVLEQLIPLQH